MLKKLLKKRLIYCRIYCRIYSIQLIKIIKILSQYNMIGDYEQNNKMILIRKILCYQLYMYFNY